MFIAFEGPDKAGKSTIASKLTDTEGSIYNITADRHRQEVIDHKRRQIVRKGEEQHVVTYDRIDWLSHMAYRLAMPEHEWNDDRVRRVFTMPETHLVFRLHNPTTVGSLSDELYEGENRLEAVNKMYKQIANWLMEANPETGYTMFRSITVMEVTNLGEDGFFSKIISIQSKRTNHRSFDLSSRSAYTAVGLLEILRTVDEREK